MLALAAVLTACSTGERGEEREGGSSRPPRANVDVRTGHIDRPLDRYFLSPQDVLLIRKAEVTLINRCMRDLDYESNPMPIPQLEPDEANLSEFLVIPMAEAKETGYRAGARKASTSETKWSRLSTRTQRGLVTGTLREYKGHAVPNGGCSALANQALRKGTESRRTFNIGGASVTYDATATPDGIFDSVMSAMRYSAAQESSSDKRVTSVTEDWSSCMQSAGFQYASPRAAVNDSRWPKSNEPTKLEISTAVTDMKCKKETYYLDTVVEVQSEYERKIIADQSANIKSLQRDLKVWLSNSKEALGA
ncbi:MULTISPECIES: hypothetical protein [unclassified Streptomyces]|uniref:hypothetical protein n=1 Tax=unclassified Streptomyces TaxID=2593676 RepID=UPI0011613310|nr:hypothetical protein [Streptomyces sp. TSRI0107]